MWRSPVAQRSGGPEVASSNLVIPTKSPQGLFFRIYTFRIIKRSRTTKLHQKRLQRYDFFAIYTIVTDSFAVFLSHLHASLHPSFQERRGSLAAHTVGGIMLGVGGEMFAVGVMLGGGYSISM